MASTKRPFTKASDRIRQEIEASIKSGALLPGDAIDEAELARVHAVSRTPIREALIQLQAQGMLTSLPRGGMLVAKMDLQQLLSLWELLAELEGLAARLACQRMTPDELAAIVDNHQSSAEVVARDDMAAWQQSNLRFHELIYRATRNPYLRQEVLRIRTRTGVYRQHAFAALGSPGPYDYSRSGNPTRTILADALADLEGGAGAVVTTSGMSAVTTALHALVPMGGRVVVPFDCYGGSWRLFDALARKGAFRLDLADLSDPGEVARALATPADLVWIETPSNPLLRVTDVAATAAAAHAAGALVVADNTFCSPVVQRPLELGADVVVHSTTKYINGHSDVIAGAVIAAHADHHTELGWWANTLGATGSAFDAYLTLRGLRTLHLRMAAAQANAQAIAEFLAGRPLPGAGVPSGSRPGRSAAGGLRRDRHLRGGGRAGCRRPGERAGALLPGRIPGRRGVADLAHRLDDPRRHAPRGARRRRHHRRHAPHQRWRGGPRRPDRRPGRWTGARRARLTFEIPRLRGDDR